MSDENPACDNNDKLWLAEQIPTQEEIDRVEQAAALDDDLDPYQESDVDDDGTHPVDPDPYGWIAGVEAGHPDFVEAKPEPPHVIVWQHAMIDPQRFDHAVAKVLPNGTLLVTPRGSDVPLKGYAPGVWVTFEHIGAEYHVKPQPYLTPEQQRVLDRDRARAAQRPGRVQTTNYAEQEKVAVAEMTRVLTDLARRTPPTHESDADDTQSLPKVVSEQIRVGGGAEAPKARGVREDAASTGPTPQPGTGVPGSDEPVPGRLKSLWHALRNPDWSED